MAVDLNRLKAQMDRTASVAHEARYADTVRVDLVKVVQGLVDAVVALRNEVDELKRHTKG